MEKISGIIKGSSRVTNVDVKDSAPVRPGMPSFGRPEGTSALRERPVMESSVRRGMEEHNNIAEWRTKEDHRAEIAASVSDKFFAKQSEPRGSETRGEQMMPMAAESNFVPSIAEARVSKPAGFKELSSRAALEGPGDDFESEMHLYPKGSFIDYNA